MSSEFNFSGEICLSRLLELADELRRAVTAGASITLDGAEFTAVDYSGLQLLLAAQRRAERSGADLRVVVPATGALRDAIRHYGLADDVSGRAPLPFVEAA